MQLQYILTYEALERAWALVRMPTADLGVSYDRYRVTGIDPPATGKTHKGQGGRMSSTTHRLDPAPYVSRHGSLVALIYCILALTFLFVP